MWPFLLPKLEKEQELQQLKISHNRFKRNYNIFNALISKLPTVNTNIKSPFEIILGNKNNNAPLKITLITSPLCGHCRDAHNLMEQLLERNERDIQIQIYFLVKTKERSNSGTKIALRLLEIYHNNSIEQLKQALHEAYSGMSPDIWLLKWRECKNTKYVDVLEKESAWCLENKFNFTPLILINGRSFPKEYERSDLLYFTDEIIENQKHKIENLVSEFEV